MCLIGCLWSCVYCAFIKVSPGTFRTLWSISIRLQREVLGTTKVNQVAEVLLNCAALRQKTLCDVVVPLISQPFRLIAPCSVWQWFYQRCENLPLWACSPFCRGTTWSYFFSPTAAGSCFVCILPALGHFKESGQFPFYPGCCNDTRALKHLWWTCSLSDLWLMWVWRRDDK